MNFWNWIVAHWKDICSALFGVVLVATLVIKLTPTTKDDAFITKVINFIDKFSLAKTANDKKMIEIAKETLDHPTK